MVRGPLRGHWGEGGHMGGGICPNFINTENTALTGVRN